LERYYFEEAFPGIWQKVAELIGSGRFFISEEVYEEAKKKAGVVKAWCESDTTGLLIVPTDGAVAREVQAVLKGTPKLVMNMKGRNRADPFVSAVARIRSATVVTGEGSDGTEDRPKIPYVCTKLAIPCTRFTELIRSEGWRFTAG
jgi:hypothetical protein